MFAPWEATELHTAGRAPSKEPRFGSGNSLRCSTAEKTASQIGLAKKKEQSPVAGQNPIRKTNLQSPVEIPYDPVSSSRRSESHTPRSTGSVTLPDAQNRAEYAPLGAGAVGCLTAEIKPKYCLARKMIKSKSKSKSIKELGRRAAAIKECRELGFGALAGPESRPESIWTVGGGPQATGSVGAGEWNGVVGCAGRCVGAAGRGRRGPGPGVNLAPCGRDFGGSKRRFFGPCSR